MPEPLLGYPGPKATKEPRFPMKFREFLRRIFGGRYHADRLHLYRKFLFEHFEAASSKQAEAQVIEIIKKQGQEGITNPNWFFEVKHEIPRWRRLNRINQRKEAAKSRWLKEKQRKSVDSSLPPPK
jgi:hypothetical protein